MIDWDKAAQEKKESNERTDRHRQLEEQRSADFWREIPAWSSALATKFASEADHYNETRAKMPSDSIEISHGEGGVELRKLSAPSGYLGVKIIRGRDSADLECTISGNAFDGRAEPTVTHYSAMWSPIGFVIRSSSGKAISEDDFIQRLMMPFARYISA